MEQLEDKKHLPSKRSKCEMVGKAVSCIAIDLHPFCFKAELSFASDGRFRVKSHPARYQLKEAVWPENRSSFVPGVVKVRRSGRIKSTVVDDRKWRKNNWIIEE
ncbi:hypothetical protein T11_15845 [Trichinella zimbabwensis]|uniref:Uncharacterized protein n=1 Tax=Trichinella zimbabwensis TaxID=268475 RepID=A0A0V1HBK4_9BILA|nr:hypothetical protein T11_15845 [Trichinella zimbabwensis]